MKDLLDLNINTMRDLTIILAAIEMNAGKNRDIGKLDLMSAKERIETDEEYMNYATKLTIHLLNYLKAAERFYTAPNPVEELMKMMADILHSKGEKESESPTNPNLKNLN